MMKAVATFHSVAWSLFYSFSILFTISNPIHSHDISMSMHGITISLVILFLIDCFVITVICINNIHNDKFRF